MVKKCMVYLEKNQLGHKEVSRLMATYEASTLHCALCQLPKNPVYTTVFSYRVSYLESVKFLMMILFDLKEITFIMDSVV